MKTYELLREEEWTTDGRKITRGAISWPNDPIPVIERKEGDYTSKIIGTVTNIRREGDGIFGDTDADIADGRRLTCAIDTFKAQDAEDVKDGVEVMHGRLISAHVSDASAWPWKD